MSTEENRALVRRWFEEVMSQGDTGLVDEICADCHPAFVVIRGVMPNAPGGIPGLKALTGQMRASFPDFRFTLDDQVAEGDKVATRLTVHGTHQGEFFGLPPTGKSLTMTGISIWEVRGGKLIQGWVSWDMLGALQQLGAIPMPGNPPINPEVTD